MTIEELGDERTHSCYVCFDDWALVRRRCWRRQFQELMIQHLKNTPNKESEKQ